MNFKNTSVLTIISVCSLGLLSSCGKKNSDTKPASFSGSYKIVAFACGTEQSNFTPEGVSPQENSSYNLFTPAGFDAKNPPTNRTFKITYENNKYNFVFTEVNSKNHKCRYREQLKDIVSNSNANVISLDTNHRLYYSPENHKSCDKGPYTDSQFRKYHLDGTYTFAQNDTQYTLTSETNDYCKTFASRYSKDKLILTLEKE